jgi:hypothetical protein
VGKRIIISLVKLNFKLRFSRIIPLLITHLSFDTKSFPKMNTLNLVLNIVCRQNYDVFLNSCSQ